MLYRLSRHLLLICTQVSSGNNTVHRKEKRKNNLIFVKAVRDLDQVCSLGIACASSKWLYFRALLGLASVPEKRGKLGGAECRCAMTTALPRSGVAHVVIMLL